MSNGKINEKILKVIRENTPDDSVLSEFLIDLIYEETKHLGWWKDIYRKKVQQYSEKWGGTSEN